MRILATCYGIKQKIDKIRDVELHEHETNEDMEKNVSGASDT